MGLGSQAKPIDIGLPRKAQRPKHKFKITINQIKPNTVHRPFLPLGSQDPCAPSFREEGGLSMTRFLSRSLVRVTLVLVTTPSRRRSSTHGRSSATADKEDVTKKTSKILENRGKSADFAKSKHPTSFRSHLTRETSTRVDSAMQNTGETTLRSDEGLPVNQLVGAGSTVKREINEAADSSSGFKPSKDSKPLLKLKFKNPYIEQRSSWASGVVEEKNPIKGPRSKRKRPSIEKVSTLVDENYEQLNSDESMNEDIDAVWILKKLGRDAIGKRIEVHKVSGNSWHKGVVSDIIEGTSSLSVHFDDGRPEIVELTKQRVRFISQKRKGTKA